MLCGLSVRKGVLVALVVGVISFALNASGYFNARTPIVHTENGFLRGYITRSRDGRDYSAYVGIPYAEPPVGQLRFESPVPAKSWAGVLEADTYAPDCYQFDALVKGKFLGDESCLFLNVYRPNIEASSLPVMIWIHGGGFFSGGAKQYDPKYFMDEDVIVVTLNYRLGALGFLNTGDATVRGNMGLKDQRLAFQWVQNNIESFGGDKNKVSLFGESAGGGSVHSHIISPSTKGLFSRAIIQSGSIFAPWSLNNNPGRQAKAYGKMVGCPDKDIKEMVACLKQQNPKKLAQHMQGSMDRAPFTSPDEAFVPTVEDALSDDAMFTENPRVLMEQGKFNKVPVIMGVTSGEGGLRTSRLEAIEMSVDTVDKNWYDFAPVLLIYDPKNRKASQNLREYYFNDQPFTVDEGGFLRNFTMMMSDGWFFHSLHKAASFHSKFAPTYLYFYDYESSLPGMYSIMKAVRSDDWLMAHIKIGMSMAKDYFRRVFGYHGPHEYGACHADDLVQLFKIDWILEIGQRSGDYNFSKNFVKTLVDFASNDKKFKFNGKVWPMIESKNTNQPFLFMKLDKDGAIIKEPFFKRLSFWDSLNIRNWTAKIHW